MTSRFWKAGGNALLPGSNVFVVSVGIQLASTLTDNFNDNTMGAQWTTGQFLDPTATTTGVTVAETSGQLQITGPADGGVHYSGYLSVNQFKLQGDQMVVKVPNAASIATGVIAAISFGQDVNNVYTVQITNNTVAFYERVAGTKTNYFTGVSLGSYVWFKLSESGGTLSVYGALATASTPPVSGDWTLLGTGAVDAGVPVTSGYVNLAGGTWTTVAGTVQFDGLNTAP